MSSLFPDHFLAKAEEEVSHHEESYSAGSSQKKPGRCHPYFQFGKEAQETDWTSGVPAWKQLKHRMQGKKSHGKASTYQ